VFASVDVQPTWSGKILGLLAKPAEVRIALQTPTASQSYRLITTNAVDGVFLSSFLDTAQTLTSAFNGTAGTSITSITLSTATPWQWQTPVCVAFSSVASS
jgi:hypothetical protein